MQLVEKKLNELSDEELISEFQKSNSEAVFKILMKRYKNSLMNYVYRFLGDYEACVDIVQETFIKVFRYKDSYSSAAKFSTWIYTIAGNLARSEYRRRKKRITISIDSSFENNEKFEIPDEHFMPDAAADEDLKDEIIQNALLKISATYREAVILRDIQGLSYEEIANIMNISVGTVKSRINRGRGQLKKLLRKLYKD